MLIVDSLKTIGGIPFINPKSQFLKGDILDTKILKKIKKWKPQAIYHLAAQSGGLTKEACLNTRGLEDFLSLLEK